MPYTEYPNNSLNKAKETAEQTKKISLNPVAHGKLQKKGFWKQTADAFFGNHPADGKTLGEHVWFDGVIPAIKTGIVNIVSQALFGESYVPRGGIVGNAIRTGASKIAYSSLSTQRAQGGTLPKDPETRGVFDYDELIYETRGDAESVLDRMFELIDSPYGRVTVGDLYDLSQVSPGSYVNCDYGWTNLSGSRVMRNADNTFSLYIPIKPRPLR